jgi:uncharacterized RDD family membrane protein YckC
VADEARVPNVTPSAPAVPPNDASLVKSAVPPMTTPPPVAPPITGAAAAPETPPGRSRRRADEDEVRVRTFRGGKEVRTDRAWVHRRPAGFVSRGLAFLMDVVLVVALSTIVFQLTIATFGMLGMDLRTCRSFVPLRDLPTLFLNVCRILRGSTFAIAAILPPIYFFVSWMINGQTLGMAFTGVRVVRTNGKSVGMVTALTRLAGLSLSLAALGLGLLWALFDRDRQGWHDKIARTNVIYWRREVAYREYHGYHGMHASGYDAPDGRVASDGESDRA